MTEADWWFRQVSMAGGALAQRLCLLAAGAGLTARVHNGYDCRFVGQLLRLAPTELPVFQVLLGRSRPGGSYGVRLGLQTALGRDSGE